MRRSHSVSTQADDMSSLPASQVSRKENAGRRRSARRTQKSRSEEARDRLLRSTVEVLIDRGYNGLTTKEVASRAGFSNGALVHHYSTKSELVVAATAFVYDRAIENGKRIAQSRAAVRNPLRAFIRDCEAVYFEWPFLAALEVLVVARTEPTLMAQIQPVMENYRRVMNEIWLEAFCKSGISASRARELQTMTLNIVRGMALNSIWQKDVRAYKSLLERWIKTYSRLLHS